MLNINPGVILREAADGALLFHPDSGKLFRMNRSGCFIWQCLSRGMSEAQIVDAVRELPGAPESPECVVDMFLARLAAQHFIDGYAGRNPIPPPSAPAKPEDRAVYEMNSMFRVFETGDALVLKNIPFEEIRPGDVVAFHPNGFDAPGVVHRVIRRTKEHLVTMGDNNSREDERRVTIKDFPRLVTVKIAPDNVRRGVAHGQSGLRQFRINRIRRTLRLLGGAIFRPLLPLMFWRIKLTEFSNGKYYYQRRLIAEFRDAGVIFVSPWYKFRFRVSVNACTRKG